MAAIDLKIEQLVLDNDNPRITHALGQQEAMQKVVRDQGAKLVRLTESIVEKGLSPIERLMVLEVSANPQRFIALEGNRRVTALKLLTNPAQMTGLTMAESVRRQIEKLAAIFDKSKVEPMAAYEVPSREDGRYWIELRHNGEDEGRGVVGWKPIVAARFRDREPAIQALDLVLEHGGFSEAEAEAIRTKFSLTTLRRLIESEDVKKLVGLTVKDRQLHTILPGGELIKPLRRMVTDIADKKVSSRSFNKTEQMVEYVEGFLKEDSADLAKTVPERSIEGLQKSEFKKVSAKGSVRRRADPSERREVVPKNCILGVTDNRIAEIFRELRTLKLGEARNSIAILLRVFLELSVDHFLEANGRDLSVKTGGGDKFKKLDKKLAEAVDILVGIGVPRAHFDGVIRGLSVQTSPMHIDLLHRYVHDRFQTPSASDLTAAWNNAQPLFEKIWPVEL